MWYRLSKIIISGKQEVLQILGEHSELLGTVYQITQESKLQPAVAYFLLQGISINQLTEVFSQLNELLKRKPFVVITNKNGVTFDNKIFTEWLRFSEAIHGYYSLIRPKNYQQYDVSSQPSQYGDISVVKIHNVAEAIEYGRGEGWCISQPVNTMWQSYRDTQSSTFYFVTDNTRSPDDPLHHVAVDVTKHGIELTDKNNHTGTIAEFNQNSNAYMQYLQSRGVDISQFQNDPLTKEEIKESELLGYAHIVLTGIGYPDKDLEWFVNLSYDYKTKYIGRGHELSNEQFEYLVANNAQDLINQYINARSILLNDEQLNKLNKQQYKTYERMSIIMAIQKPVLLTRAAYDTKNNPRIIMEAAKRNHSVLTYASGELKNNPQFILELIKEYPNAMWNVSDVLKNNPDFMLDVIKAHPYNIIIMKYNMSDRLKNNPDFILRLIQQNHWAEFEVSDELKNDPEFMAQVHKITRL